ncbi:MAG: hypothetical protein DIZ80_03235 [endosymbiont of Galathealinum brachiosum]|uniref:Uncharacterized protein n=1 Tax=endosymbiont of Galathealinum brachiosum TaxID=2200906 RepID=A0A370DJN6_9GAMM|nr:MAG: hypothetical protein DIZ80_03235 [endosymbiont of Galathealinum brachiosum]
MPQLNNPQNPPKNPQKTGLRKAVDNHCKDCIYDQSNGLGTWRQQVYLCHMKSCELYDFRPTPTTTAAIQQAEYLENGEK